MKLKIPKINSAYFTCENSVATNHLYLLEPFDQPPFIRVTPGWRAVGWAAAPWLGTMNQKYALMLERVEGKGGRGDECIYGERYWHHVDEDRLERMFGKNPE